MSSFTRTAGVIGATVLTTAALTTAPSAEAATGSRVIAVPCSTAALITAIGVANVTPSTLHLAPSCTYVLTGGLPTISGTMAFVGGPSTRLRATNIISNNFRILSVIGGHLRVRGIFIENASLINAGGAAVLNLNGTLVLDHVTLTGNTVTNGAGGGLQNAAGSTTLVTRSTIVGNTSVGATDNGGGILNEGTLTLFQSRVSANTTSAGGAGLATSAGGTSRVIQSTIDHNAATGNGGGVFNAGSTSIERTRIVRNSAASGGGVFGSVTARGSIVRRNVPDNCVPAGPGCG
ncbi:hypothetical protein [Actinomadura sp. DC4]|uniref:hypothetical protein n=1 Tax=Actinomadura sp. DC4 TaxID=3055069 RepID=UPI0025B0DEC3|nr:hypothetical protein [Actinomadura sp. DC4]MDN3352079.1 hypothetical protein [Actinomadura sp. DC4]